MGNTLKKELSFIGVFSLAAGAMISSGIFILPGIAYASAGPAVVLSYFLAGILALTGVLNVVELSTAMPKAGGDYYYVNRSMGPMLGTLSGVMSWFALSLKTAFAIFGIAELLGLMLGFNTTSIGLVVCGIFVVINILGVKEAVRLEIVLVLGLLTLMILYFFLGITSVEVSHFDPFAPKGMGAVLLTTGFVFVSFGGLLKISSVAEEVVNPQRNIPLGMIVAVVVITILYVLLLVVTVGLLPAEQLQNSLTPVADAAGIFAGKIGFYAISVAAMLAFITTANAGIMAASRYPIALSRDNLLPKFLCVINKRFATPVRSVLLTGIFIAVALFLPLEVLVKAASTVVLTSYILANVAIIILRESKLQNYRPSFTAPFYPWMQVLSIIAFGVIISDMGLTTLKISLGIVAVAMLLYFFYGKKRADFESAWVHLIARVGNKKLDSYDLEAELKGIIHHRDEIVFDTFDAVVSRAAVLDIEEEIDRDTLFTKVAEVLEDRIGSGREKICELLEEREESSSTAFIPTVAIPHIILDGENIFELVLVRSRKGIFFTNSAPKVGAIFVIIGTQDKRQLHLQALAAIAQVIQGKDFDQQWQEAKNENLLKDILLLSDRRRA